jgi:alpha-glucosidase
MNHYRQTKIVSGFKILTRNWVFPVFLCVLWTLSLQATVQAEYEANKQGVCIKLKGAQVEVSTPAHGVLGLNVSHGQKIIPVQSIFLAKDREPDAWQLVNQDNKVGIKTESGQLVVDQTDGNWVLSDAAGRVLAQGSAATQQKNSDEVAIDIALSKDAKMRIYGSGNNDPKKKSLIQTEGDSRLGNGLSVIPYYWCTDNYGVFAVSGDDDRPAKWKKDEGRGVITWKFPGESADLYLIPAENLYEAARGYAALTGYPTVPPKWSFGYLQSRWGWEDKIYIDNILADFHKRKIPVDAFLFDFEAYYKTTPDYSFKEEGEPNFPDFNWNPALFPNPAANIADYRKQGIQIVIIRKPRIGDQETLKMLREKNWLLAAGGNGEVADLMNKRDLDFRNPEVRKWYADQLYPMLKDGVAGWWNDEGESSYTKYYYWNLAQVDMLNRHEANLRHWSLNRSFEPGLQRLGGTAWTGDIRSKWTVLEQTPASLLNWGLAGMPFSGCDIGGFKTDPDAQGKRPSEIIPELMTRWMQAGIFFPIMRTHSQRKMVPHFPWLYGSEAETAMRKAIELRYRLLPFYYSLAHETHATGAPMMRPLVMEFVEDSKVQNLSDQWLMGTGRMVAPIFTESNTRDVYVPDDMYDFEGTKIHQRGEQIQVTAKLDEIPIYVRKGTILPLSPIVQNVSQLPGGPLEVQIYSGKDAAFTLVEDDGISNDYLNGKVRRTYFKWDEAKRTLAWNQEGNYAGKDVFTQMKVLFFYPNGKKEVTQSLTALGALVLEK